MAEGVVVCPKCGATVPEEALICPDCHALLEGPTVSPSATVPANPPPVPAPPKEEASHRKSAHHPRAGRSAGPETPNPFAAELGRRLARLRQWSEGTQALHIALPKLPEWAEEMARSSGNPEPWAEVVRGIERLAQKRIVTAFEEWEKRTKVRLTRLEAYSVDSRLERDQIEDALHSARSGEVAQALASFQQVDRVVTLKERHLDQAREELERVIALLHDMEALGIEPPQDVTEVADDLESELRAGKLAPLKQQIRAIRLQAVTRLKTGLPQYISEYGDYLLSERSHGIATELEALELARGAREFFRGRPEDGVRRLRALQQRHGLLPNRPTHGSSRSVAR
ncbi:MAG TPA: hypothetical protein VEG66_01390 [Thermoplasmata archaeon]|jgi:hypothetical protein|nr:hypothetical protein [Thermoplasmata archaeon]